MTDDQKFRPTDMMKKIFAIGVGTFFLTEESLRGLLSEFKLPKELLAGLLDSANKTRKEFMQNMTQEVLNRVMDKVNPKDLVTEILHENDLHFEIKVKVTPRETKKDST